MPYVWDFAILGKYSHLFWLGLGWTMAYTIGTIVLGTLIGLVVGILRLRRLAVIDWLLVAYIELFRGTPVLLQLYVLYYGLSSVIRLGPIEAAILGLGLNYAAYEAEVHRGALAALPRGQAEAAEKRDCRLKENL